MRHSLQQGARRRGGKPRIWLAMVLLVSLPGLAGLLRGEDADTAKTTNLQGKVTEIKGRYCKVDLTAADGLEKGQQGELHRGTAEGELVSEVVISFVLEDYSVVKVKQGEPMVGDVLVLTVARKATPSTTETPPEQPTMDSAVGKEIEVELKSGTKLDGITLLRFTRDDDTGAVKTLRVENSDGKKATLTASTIASATLDGSTLKLEGDGGDQPKRERPKSRNQILAEKRAAREAEERKQWLARLEARGIKPWPELSEEQHQEAVDVSRKMFEEVKKDFPTLALYETYQFMFCSNMPPEQCKPYVLSLDAMYAMMCKMYRIKKGQPVWRGKCLVFAFLHQQEFVSFEGKYMGHATAGDTYGLCHSFPSGKVIIACYRGDRPEDFGHMLVHETSHGFIHRYRTGIRMPSWVNEGMAEYIGAALVPSSKSVKRKQQLSLEQMKQTRSLGGNFFALNKNIDSWQYGVASSMNDFLIRNSTEKYVQFIEGLKEGKEWTESLKDAYNVTPEQLVSGYGQAIGVPDLRP